MGREALDRALAGHPHLRPLLKETRERLLEVIDHLEPYVDAKRDTDPDLRFQVSILRQAEKEMGFMLKSDGATA